MVIDEDLTKNLGSIEYTRPRAYMNEGTNLN
jgi:hypothetical protein